MGVFTVQDDITNFIIPGSQGSNEGSLPFRSLGSVFRFRRDVSRSSNVGVVMTDRRADGYHNTAGGIDGLLKFTKKDEVNFQVLGSTTRYPDQIVTDFEQQDKAFNGNAMFARYSHDSEHINLYTIYEQVDPDFRADLGFMTRAGFRYNEVGATYKWRRDPGHWFNWISMYGSYDFRRDFDGNVLHRAATSRLYYEGPLQSYAGVYGELGRDLFDGQYFRMNWLEFWFGSRPSGAFRFNFSGTVGDQIDYANTRAGKRFRLAPLIEFRTGLHFSAELTYQFERLHVDAGRLYTAHIGYLKTIYQINKQAFIRVIFQSVNYERNTGLYVDEDVLPKNHDLFSQVLFSYKINPQTVLFLGYSDNYYADNQLDLRQTNRTFFTKVGYAWRP